MVYGCGNKFVKYSVFFINLLVCIVGAAILAISLALVFSSNFQDYIVNILNGASLDGSEFKSLSAIFYITAAVGGLIFLTGFLGCCGAACENRCILGIFFTIILILFLAELGLGIAALVMKGDLESKLFKAYTNTVLTKYQSSCNNPDDSLTKSWNTTQNDLGCCGCNGYSDYHSDTLQWPGNCPQPCATNLQNPTTQGCCEQIWNILDDNITIVGGVAIGLLVVELLAMIFSCILCSAVASKSRYS